MAKSIDWQKPRGQAPRGWMERHAIFGNWFLKVWVSGLGYFECSMTHMETNERRRLDIGEPLDLKAACEEAEELARQLITKT